MSRSYKSPCGKCDHKHAGCERTCIQARSMKNKKNFKTNDAKRHQYEDDTPTARRSYDGDWGTGNWA